MQTSTLDYLDGKILEYLKSRERTTCEPIASYFHRSYGSIKGRLKRLNELGHVTIYREKPANKYSVKKS